MCATLLHGRLLFANMGPVWALIRRHVGRFLHRPLGTAAVESWAT